MDLWILQAARVLQRRRRREGGSSLDSLVNGEALFEEGADGLDPSLAFTLKLARALLSCGMPAQRVEESLHRLADALGFDIEPFCTPTAIFVTMAVEDARGPQDVRTRVVRVEPGNTDLERLSALYDLVGRVERREITPGDGAQRIEAILARPPRWRPLATALGFGLNSTSAAILLGGGGLDLPVAAALGLLVGCLDVMAQRVPTLGRLLPALAAFGVSFLASMLAWCGAPVRPSVVLLASIIVLLPGLTVTTATVELATAHLVSGTARLMGGLVTFLQLGFGVALGRKIAAILPEMPTPPPADVLPEWWVLLAGMCSALGFTVVLRAKPRDFVWVLAAVMLGLAGSQLGGRVVGPELGAFVGSLLVASASHVFARWQDRPLNLMLVPGTLLLVPGSVGFLSVSSLLENDVLHAIETAFRMWLIATALAAGLLVATAAVPPRNAL